MYPAPVVSLPYRIRHHWVVLFARPRLWVALCLVALALVGFTSGWLGWVPLIVVLIAMIAFRIQEWRAEVIELDRSTIRHWSGVRETTVSQAMMRIDRISGLVITRTVPGKILGYGSLHLEAPGSHPKFRDLEKIELPGETFELLQSLMFQARGDRDPNDVGPNDVGPEGVGPNDVGPNDVGPDDTRTSPLPSLSADGDTGRLPHTRYR